MLWLPIPQPERQKLSEKISLSFRQKISRKAKKKVETRKPTGEKPKKAQKKGSLQKRKPQQKKPSRNIPLKRELKEPESNLAPLPQQKAPVFSSSPEPENLKEEKNPRFSHQPQPPPDFQKQDEFLPLSRFPQKPKPLDPPAKDQPLRDTERSLRFYAESVRQKILSTINYPQLARKKGVEGKVLVSISLKRNGQLKEVAVAQPSEAPLLEKAVLEAIEKASPFPPFPEGIQKSFLSLRIPVVFKLR